MKRAYIEEIAGFLLIVVLTYSAGLKLFDIEGFQVKLLRVHYLPVPAIRPLSVTIPVLEIIAVVLFFNERFRTLSLLLIYPLMILFTGHLIILNKLSPGTPCSCGGIFEALTFRDHLLVNLLLLSFSAGLLIRRLKQY